jgi:hypothetical protein
VIRLGITQGIGRMPVREGMSVHSETLCKHPEKPRVNRKQCNAKCKGKDDERKPDDGKKGDVIWA